MVRPRPSGASCSAALVIGLAFAAFRLFTREAGIGALIGVGLLPAIAIINELSYLSSDHEVPTTSSGVWLMLVPALAAVVIVVLTTRQSLRPSPGPH